MVTGCGSVSRSFRHTRTSSPAPSGTRTPKRVDDTRYRWASSSPKNTRSRGAWSTVKPRPPMSSRPPGTA